MSEIRKKPRYQIHKLNQGVFKGSKFVKKAGLTIVYENYNTLNKTDKQEWSSI